mmetsp:Transcript_162415/g.299668  ORF Transcript_162415/g.299668 Transcript_162415/m.299668 type:complete len:483 (+) Transcript_162415:109-1557(+)
MPNDVKTSSGDGLDAPTKLPSKENVACTKKLSLDSFQTTGLRELAKKARAGKGHRNLLIRGCTALLSAVLTAILIAYSTDNPHKVPTVCAQVVSASSLFIQWRTGRPSMFVLRACCNFAIAVIDLHGVVCGRNPLGGKCSTLQWRMRRVTWFFILRAICNGASLVCQFRYPHVMFRGHGNLQLFCRGCIQATAVLLGAAKLIFQLRVQLGHKLAPDHLILEIIIGCISSFLLVPISAGSLFHQWWMTSAGKTGHAKSDAWERYMDPAIDCPRMNLKVSILSARGLRNADWANKSDPYCVCEVLGRPQSTWKTSVQDNTLDPVWNEGQELAMYRQHDSLRFSLYDSDMVASCWGLQLFNDPDDFLGEVTLPGQYFENFGFSGELPLLRCGKGKKASLMVKVELLGGENGEASTVASTVEAMVASAGTAVVSAVEAVANEVRDLEEQAVDTVENVAADPKLLPRLVADEWLRLRDPFHRAIVCL